jgi:hypothetical protein
VNRLDERLSEAADNLRALVGEVVHVPELPRSRPPRGQRILAGALCVFLLAGALVSALALTRTGHRGARFVTGGGATPAEVVGWDGSVVMVISSTTGRVLRTLGPTDGLLRGRPTFSVTPDGASVYFSRRAARTGECDAGSVKEIARVATAGGPTQSVAPGVVPSVSPDGRFLAYFRSTASSCDTNFDQIVVRDLTTGGERAWRSTPERRIGSLGFVLSWTADSRHIGFDALLDTVSPVLQPRLLAIHTASSLDDSVPVPHAAGTTWAGFLGTTGASLGIRGAPWETSNTNSPAVEILQLDGSTGAVQRVLFTLPSPLFTGNVFDGTESMIQPDRDGRHILVIGLSPGTRSGTGVLYQWTEGDRAPSVVTGNIASAAWVPDNASPAHEIASSGTRTRLSAIADSEIRTLGGRVTRVEGVYSTRPNEALAWLMRSQGSASPVSYGPVWIIQIEGDGFQCRTCMTLLNTTGNNRVLVVDAASFQVVSTTFGTGHQDLSELGRVTVLRS